LTKLGAATDKIDRDAKDASALTEHTQIKVKDSSDEANKQVLEQVT